MSKQLQTIGHSLLKCALFVILAADGYACHRRIGTWLDLPTSSTSGEEGE